MQAPLELWLVIFPVLDTSVPSLLSEWRQKKGMLHIMPNKYISERKIPDDPDFSRQWQYINDGSSNGVINADLDMDMAWEITTGGLTTAGDTIVVCIIDSGINGNHPDLKPNLWINRYEIPNNGIDDDGNGFIDDRLGWNAVDQNDMVYNNSNHGSSVAGIVGAKGNNGIGVAGVNWDVKLMIVNYGRPTEANALASYAYPYAMRKLYNETSGVKGAYVVATNASWGLDKTKADEAPIWCALYDSLGVQGILNCGATINEGIDVDVLGDMPTSCESEFLIGITNMNRADQKVGAAGFGSKSIDLGAYGHQTFTTTSGSYGAFGGTSAAAPHVAGTIGLMYATACDALVNISKSDPAAAALIVKDMILHGVTPNNSLKNITTTGGRLNTHRSLENILQLCATCAPPAGIYFIAEDKSVKVLWANFTGDAVVSLRYRREGTDNWSTINNVINGTIINDLEYCTVYEIQLGSDCGRLPGEFSYSKYFTTSKCCIKPTNLTLNSDQDNITVNWEYPEYYGNTEMEYRQFGGEWQSLSVFGRDTVISGLPECALYQFRVSNVCAEVNAVSPFTDIAEISTECGKCTSSEYCAIRRVDASQEWIESIKIGDQTFVSGKSKTGYSYLLGAFIYQFEEKSSIPIEITPGFAGQSFDENYKVYIDLNQNGAWEDGELVFSNPVAANNVVKGNIVIPSQITEGYTRMRIIMTYDTFPGACDHPKFEFGEAEDYCVLLKLRECPFITSVNITDIDTVAARFTPNFSNFKADSIQLHIKKSTNQDYSEFIFRDSTFILMNLDSCTDYEYRVTAFCRGSLRDDSFMGMFRTGCRSSSTDIQHSSQITVFPNPFKDQLSFVLPDTYGLPESIILTTVNGIQLECDFSLSDFKSNTYTVKIPEFISAGMYILRIQSKSGIFQYKVVKF